MKSALKFLFKILVYSLACFIGMAVPILIFVIFKGR